MACGVKQDQLWGFLFELQVILNLGDNFKIHPTKKRKNSTHKQQAPNENLTQLNCFGLKLATGKG